MISRSKPVVDAATLARLFELAGFPNATAPSPLGDGEFNAVYTARSGGREVVIKIAPASSRHMLHYEHDMMRSEVAFYGIMAAAGIRVPRVLHVDFSGKTIGSDWFVMERIDGTRLDQAGLDPTDRSVVADRIAEMLARLHGVRGEGFGYRQSGLHPDWHAALRSMTRDLIDDGRKRGCLSLAGGRLLHAIDRHAQILREVDARLVNFDLWPPNLFVTRSGQSPEIVWIDPERCFYGDPVADFVALDFEHRTLDDKRDAIDRYNRHADNPLRVDDRLRIRFAIMLGYLALILQVEKYARYSPFHFGWWRNVAASRMLFRTCFETIARIEHSSPKEERP